MVTETSTFFQVKRFFFSLGVDSLHHEETSGVCVCVCVFRFQLKYEAAAMIH